MLSYVFRRLLVGLSVMLTVAVVSFMLLHLSGDLATAARDVIAALGRTA